MHWQHWIAHLARGDPNPIQANKEQKEKSDLILTATSYCRTIEEKMENDELVNCSEDEKTEIQSAIGNLREVLSDNNESSTSIKEGFEKLQNLLEGKLN